jgi:hypothetical protein
VVLAAFLSLWWQPALADAPECMATRLLYHIYTLAMQKRQALAKRRLGIMRQRSSVTTMLCVVALASLLVGAGGAAAQTLMNTGERPITTPSSIHARLAAQAGVEPGADRSGLGVPISVAMAKEAMPDTSSTGAGILDARGFACGIIAIAVGLIGLLLHRLTLDRR